jgi:hypothetical protein
MRRFLFWRACDVLRNLLGTFFSNFSSVLETSLIRTICPEASLADFTRQGVLPDGWKRLTEGDSPTGFFRDHNVIHIHEHEHSCAELVDVFLYVFVAYCFQISLLVSARKGFPGKLDYSMPWLSLTVKFSADVTLSLDIDFLPLWLPPPRDSGF